MRGPRPLRSRLFAWFFAAIVLALMTGALVVHTTRSDAMTGGVEEAAAHMGARLGALWDDPAAAHAYVDEVRDVTGLDVRLVREGHRLPPPVRRVGEHGGAIVPARDKVFIPVVRGGVVVGALELDRGGGRAPPGWWRLALGLVAVVTVLSLMASRVARMLAEPLEHLAHAADRIGGGDLAYRTDVARSPQRWVALEVRDVAVSFNRMAERVEAMVRGQRELLGAISHELRSPLGRARVALEIARDRLPASAPRAEETRSPAAALDDVEKQLGAVDSILGDLLDVTRAGLADLRKETRELVAWVRAQAAEEPAPPTIAVEASEEAERLAVPFDPALLARALHNLLVNARAHGHPPEVALDVRVAREADRVRVEVRDRGPGFPPGFAEHAFEPFVRGDAARARPSRGGAGYGLGLAIVRRIVEAHGGRAFAENASEGGAVTGFDLPLAPAPR
jgi:signal transduction histidine kinase